jgi:hypothetical protein
MTTAFRLASLNLIAALIGAAALVTLSGAAEVAVQLAPVHIVAQRALVVSLPPVDIVERGVVRPVAQMVRLPAVEVIARRAPASALHTAQARPQREPI